MNKTATTIKFEHSTARGALQAKLTAAHGQLEKKFLDGGTVLISIVQIINKLIGSLDGLTSSMDGETTNQTMAGLNATARELGELPGFEDKRQKGFVELASVCRTMQGSIDEMRETMRYLRTFAITVKITGASLDEFAGFADEIQERIQSGASEVDRFARQVQDMHAQLKKAQDFSTRIIKEYGQIVPGIVAGLGNNAARVSDHHRKLAETANQVKLLARGVQGKITTVLSALQVGDITRQRIEHIQSSFELYDAFIEGEGAALDAADRARVGDAVLKLAAAQMDETFRDFQRECRSIHSNMARFVDDTHEILRLRDSMTQSQDGGGENVLVALQKGVSDAVALVSGVQDTSSQADQVARSTSATAQTLLQAIEVIRTIKTDIHYMALNSNLRCSRLGDEGRSVNVVSAELRIYAGKLEVPAEAVMSELKRLEVAAAAFSKGNDGDTGDIAGPLGEALGSIQAVSSKMDEGIAELAREGQEVFSKVSAAIATLDFESELGDVLEDCAAHSADLAGPGYADVADIEDRIADLGARIFKVYTMVQERDIHRAFLPAGNAAAVASISSTPSTDEDLFDDALF